MPEFTFACPSCHQQIQCDDAWTGQQIACPICQATIVVPPNRPAEHSPLVPKPPAGGSRLSAGVTQVARSSTGTGAPVRGFQKAPQKKKSPVGKIAIIGGCVVALAAGVYFGLPYVQKWQDDLNTKRRAAEKESGGGEAGHIAELNAVLDATEPSRSASGNRSRRAADTASADGAPAAGSNTDTNAQPTAILPAVWNLDVTKAKIPEGKVNGVITGTNFVAETIRFDKVGAAYVLNLRQGSGQSPDRGILVYVRANPTESPTGHTWTVSQDMKGGAISSVAKLWKTNPKYAAQQKSYFTGYALKLELGTLNEGFIPGKIYLALPDNEQSVVAGVFKAASNLGTPGADAVQAPIAAPVQDPAAKAAFEKRYGVRR